MVYVIKSFFIDFQISFFTDKLSETTIKSEDELEDGGELEAEEIDVDVVSDKDDDCDLDSPKGDSSCLDRSGSKSPESTTSEPPRHKSGESKTSKLQMKCKGNCAELEGVECHLETRDLWEKFFELGTEMIITKTGRLVFYYLM